jgi:hypothetical protein
MKLGATCGRSNGRLAQFAFAANQVLQLTTVISADRRFVRISVAPPDNPSVTTFAVNDQTSIRFDITDYLRATDQFALGDNERTVLSITPHIIIEEERGRACGAEK